MNLSASLRSIATASLLLTGAFLNKAVGQSQPGQQSDISPFVGHWTIDIERGGVGWLDVRQEDGYIDADLLWQSGSVQPASYVYLSGNTLIVGRNGRSIVRVKGETEDKNREHNPPSWVAIRTEGNNLSGYYFRARATGLGLDSVAIKGKKIPLPATPDMKNIKFGKPISLISKNGLTGWKLTNDRQTNGWSVVDGVLVNDPVKKEGQRISYGNLRTDREFEDFNLKLEVNVPAHSNSGVYLRGMYEVQVSDTYGQPLDSHNMGALYSRITPAVNAEKPPGEWQTMDITLYQRHVTVVLNGKTIIDNKPVYGPTGGALTSDVFAPGPLYLQGDHGKVSYRNVVITPIVK
jgi:hypothetical protein